MVASRKVFSIIFCCLLLANCSVGREDDSWLWWAGKVVVSGIAGAGAAAVAGPVVLGGLGFGAAGIAGGSIAAGVQSMIGNVAAGSGFALLQSAGAGGVGIVAKTVIGSGAAKIVQSVMDDDE